MSRWSERAWKLALFAALLAVTWLFLTPSPPEPPGPDLALMDKLQHALLFAGLALLAVRAYPDRPRWGIAAALVVYGVCIEIAQPRTGRAFDLLDILADAVGTSVLLLLRGSNVHHRGSPRSPR